MTQRKKKEDNYGTNYSMTNLMYVNAPPSTQKHALYVVKIIKKS
jgi:hypothetical protein